MYFRLVSGESRSIAAGLGRTALSAMSLPYLMVIAARDKCPVHAPKQGQDLAASLLRLSLPRDRWNTGKSLVPVRQFTLTAAL